MAGESGSAFLLLLWEPATSMSDRPGIDVADLVEEYSAWGDRIAERDQLISAEKLADESVVWLKGRSDELSAPDHMAWPVLGGYFAVRARDRAAAVDLARTSPHLKYGGAIEVRAVDEIPRP
jgi:hypothetical protein